MKMSTASPYKNQIEPPIYARVLAIAKTAGVDPGWLMFGGDSQAPMLKEWTRRGSVTPDVEAVAVTRSVPAKKAASGGRKHR